MKTADYDPFCIQTSPRLSVRVPPGSYILGDPGYAVPDDPWNAFVESCSRPDKDTLLGMILGFPVLAFCTFYGDGVYEDSHGFCYCVDQGLIGLVASAMPGAMVSESSDVIQIHEAIECWHENGVLHFGEITINTKHLPGIHDDQ